MNILENPFYILGATPLDSRRKINTLAEDKSLLLNTAEITKARDILINPLKRITAELRWFPGLDKDQMDELLGFFAELQAGNTPEEPNILDLNILANLNSKMYAFPYHEINDIFKAKYYILEISRLYESINTNELTEEINHDREISGFPSISGTAEVEKAIREYRDDIKKTISQALLNLTQEQHIELITMLSQIFIAADDRYAGSAIIDDILSEYTLYIAAEMQTQKHQIISTVSDIRESIEDIHLEGELKDLIRLVEQWNKLAHPLQLVAQGKGQYHSDSEELAHILRDLAIDFHNNHGKTAEAVLLTDALKTVFAELPEFAERIGDDVDILKNLKAEQQAEEKEHQESIRRNREDKQYYVMLNADRIVVPPFCTCCLKPTNSTENVSTSASHEAWGKKTTRTVSMNMPLCQDCLDHRKKAKSMKWLIIILSLVFAAISVPLFARAFDVNEDLFWGLPFIVAVVAYFLLGLIIKLPELGEEHSAMQQSVWLGGIEMSGNTTTYTFTNWRYAKLFATANGRNYSESNRRNRVKSRSYLRAIDHPIGVCVSTLALTGIMLFFFGSTLLYSMDSLLPGSSVTNSSSYSNPSSTSKPSSNPSSNTNTKQQRLKAMEADLNERLAEIKDMEDELESLADDVDYYESQYNLTQNNTYVNSYNDAVDEYNNLYNKYDRAINEYNDIVAEYNALNQSSVNMNSKSSSQNAGLRKTNSTNSIVQKTDSQSATAPKVNSASSAAASSNSQNSTPSKVNSTTSAASKTVSQNSASSKANPQETNNQPGTFTIGSSGDVVKSVMGTPNSVIGNTWSYGYSSVYFSNDVVSGWSIIDKNLKVYMGDKISSATFTVGSTKDGVVKAMGTPSSVIGDTWGYSYSSVYFSNGVVSGWSIIDKKLSVYMGEKISSATFIVGSTKDEVVKAMGTPSSVIGNTWSYGYSSVYFSNGVVSSWSEIDVKLNLS